MQIFRLDITFSKLIAAVMLFLVLFLGCTMSTEQMKIPADVIGMTVSEVLKVLGQPLASSYIAPRGGYGHSSGEMFYENYTLKIRDNVVVEVIE
jgi:hypothetical protein